MEISVINILFIVLLQISLVKDTSQLEMRKGFPRESSCDMFNSLRPSDAYMRR